MIPRRIWRFICISEVVLWDSRQSCAIEDGSDEFHVECPLMAGSCMLHSQFSITTPLSAHWDVMYRRCASFQ